MPSKRKQPKVPVVHICDLRVAPDRRVRRECPWHKRLCYGNLIECYDTIRVQFDCGTLLDYGYEEWRPPEAAVRRKRREAPR